MSKITREHIRRIKSNSELIWKKISPKSAGDEILTISEAIDHNPPSSPYVHSRVVTVGYIMGGWSFLHFILADSENKEKEI